MAIALDTTTASSTASFSHTCTGTNLMLFLGIGIDPSGGSVTGVTYNSVAMTQVATLADTSSGTQAYLFALANPTAGANTVVISTSGSPSLYAVAGSYTGVKSTIDSFGSGTVTGTPNTVSTTVVASSCWLVGFDSTNTNGSSMSISAGGTARQNGSLGVNRRAVFGDSNATVSTGSQSLSFAVAGGSSFFQAGIVTSIAPQVVLTKTATASVSNAASRVATVAKLRTAIKTVSVSVSNSASRLATVARVRTLVKSLSASVSNAASRLATVVRIVLKGWSTTTKSTDTFSSPQTHSSTTFTTQSKSSDSWTKQNHA